VDTIDVMYGRDHRAAAGRQIIHTSRLGFDATVAALELAIETEGLWVVARLDPQMLLSKGGFQIKPARQLFYFHPRYMARLLSANPAGIVEAPLKLVVMAGADGSVTVRHPDIAIAFDGYEGLADLKAELVEITGRIVSAVA
jgi:uncharacterized protein (DUF302 family)